MCEKGMKKAHIICIAVFKRKTLDQDDGKPHQELKAVLAFIREELKLLENGTPFYKIRIPVISSATVVDNLGMYEMLCFSRTFRNAYFICRICLCPDSYQSLARQGGEISETDDDNHSTRFKAIFDFNEFAEKIRSDDNIYENFVKTVGCFDSVGRSTICNLTPLDGNSGNCSYKLYF